MSAHSQHSIGSKDADSCVFCHQLVSKLVLGTKIKNQLLERLERHKNRMLAA